ncbi:MAG: archaellum operon transcriptional activator EarA family protein [Thermoplasmatota archaeon]
MRIRITEEERFSIRRSPLRLAILDALDRVDSANLLELATATGAAPQNVKNAIMGDGEAYRIAHGLTALGLVEPARTGDPREATRWRITTRGRQVRRVARTRAPRLGPSHR